MRGGVMLSDLPEQLFIEGTRVERTEGRLSLTYELSLRHEKSTGLISLPVWSSPELLQEATGREQEYCAISRSELLEVVVRRARATVGGLESRLSLLVFNPKAEHLSREGPKVEDLPSSLVAPLGSANYIKYFELVMADSAIASAFKSQVAEGVDPEASDPTEVFENVDRILKELAQANAAPPFFHTGTAAVSAIAPGVVYALINPSLEGMVKVGRTSRDAEARAKEVSGATGVPTPFIVAYQASFDNAEWAERYVHTVLERKGYRVTANREFFKVPLTKVVEAILEAKSNAGSTSGGGTATSDGAVAPRIGGQPPWRDVYEMAQATYFGLGDTLRDPEEAFTLFRQASRLGSPLAFWYLGLMAGIGDGTVKSRREAIGYYKQGANAGDGRCWAELGELYCSAHEEENSRKCWDRYFGSGHFQSNPQYAEAPSRASYGLAYIRQTFRRDSWEWYRSELRGLNAEIEPLIEEGIEKCRKKYPFMPPHLVERSLTYDTDYTQLCEILAAIDRYTALCREQERKSEANVGGVGTAPGLETAGQRIARAIWSLGKGFLWS
jgi:hypothetical protein